jgi:hypothetical protein
MPANTGSLRKVRKTEKAVRDADGLLICSLCVCCFVQFRYSLRGDQRPLQDAGRLSGD